MHVLGCVIFIYKTFHKVFKLALNANIMLVSIATQMFVEIISVNLILEKLHTYCSNIWKSWLQIYLNKDIYIKDDSHLVRKYTTTSHMFKIKANTIKEYKVSFIIISFL